MSFGDKIHQLVADQAKYAFFVDFDGTIVEQTPDPDAVVVPESLRATLRALCAKKTLPFAVATGRALGKLDRFLGEDIQPAAIGSHGAERRAEAKGVIETVVAALPADLMRDLQVWCDKNEAWMEDKLTCAAIFTDTSLAAVDFLPQIEACFGRHAGQIATRKDGRTYEIMQRGVNKAAAIRAFMTLPDMQGRTPVYLGDDVRLDPGLVALRGEGAEVFAVHNISLPPQEVVGDITIADVQALLSALAA